MNGLFFDDRKTNRERSFAETCVLRLIDGLRTHRLIDRVPDLSKWGSEFESLEQDVGKDKIDHVLTWYLDHLQDKSIPRAYAASSFRSKFTAIERCMEQAPGEIKLSEAASKIMTSIRHLNWPKGSDQQLPYLVEKSFQNYFAFHERMKTFRISILDRLAAVKDREEKRPLERCLLLVSYLLQTLVDHPHTFIRRWVAQVNRDITHWKEWSGTLHPFVFSEDCDRFTVRGRDCVYTYCHDSKRWDDLRQEMKEFRK